MSIPSTYEQAFEAFLSCTNEKQILQTYLTELIKVRQAQSLLDIGPGSGELSLPLSGLVGRYLAIEPLEHYADGLKKHHLDVIRADFPIPLSEQFDIVLASHVISLTDTDLESFVAGANKVMNDLGMLVIVTHKGMEADWLRFVERLGQDNVPYHRAVFEKLLELLKVNGQIELDTITTTVQSNSLDLMVASLGFIWSDGDLIRWQDFEQHESAVADLLQTAYFLNGLYSFPFEHTIIKTTTGRTL